jgi:hypothetical protein
MTYELEKKIWSDKDFEQMGWHDCRIYRIRLTEDLELDIDYILQWNKPDLEGMPFTFWVAPATLVFKNIKNFRVDIDTAVNDAIEIEDIERTQENNINRWAIITQQGDFEFLSEGYEQFIRQEPFFEFGQTISYIERNGTSLDRTTNQENSNRGREEIADRRKKNLEHYEKAKKRHLKRQEKEQLDRAKDNNEIDTKQYLLKKKEIKEMIDYYDHWLKDTIFENW